MEVWVVVTGTFAVVAFFIAWVAWDRSKGALEIAEKAQSDILSARREVFRAEQDPLPEPVRSRIGPMYRNGKRRVK